MKKNNLTLIIIVSGIAAAVCMLLKAFAPSLYKSMATVIVMYAFLGIAVLLAPEKKVKMRSYLSMLITLAVTGAVMTVLSTVNPYGFITIPVAAALAALGMIISKNEDYALSCAAFAAAAAVFSNGGIVTFLLLSVAFATAVAALNARKVNNVIVRVAAVFLICLALCAFK